MTHKKTVFKGTINGKEFNTVEAYNEEITRLATNGENIEASSQTSIVNEPEPTEYVEMLPGFNNATYHYIDDYITDDTDVNYDKCSSLAEQYEEVYPKMKEKIDLMDGAAVENYMNDLKKVLDTIKQDANKTSASISNLEQKLQTLEDSENLIILYEDLYSSLLEDAEKRYKEVVKEADGCCKAQKCECEQEPKRSSGEESEKMDYSATKKYIENFLREIGLFD